jgi:hypothetical protein
MKLFHCVVVMGAALSSGCGGSEAQESSTTTRSGLGDAASEADPGANGDAADAACSLQPFESYGCSYAGSCRGSAASPMSPSDCDQPQQLQCTGTGCRCDTAAPIAPRDCPHTEEFTCQDWSRSCGCSCSASAPLDGGACNGVWSCHSYDPPVGCYCSVIIL